MILYNVTPATCSGIQGRGCVSYSLNREPQWLMDTEYRTYFQSRDSGRQFPILDVLSYFCVLLKRIITSKLIKIRKIHLCVPVCLFVCLLVCLFACLFVCLFIPVCLFVALWIVTHLFLRTPCGVGQREKSLLRTDGSSGRRDEQERAPRRVTGCRERTQNGGRQDREGGC